MKFGTPYKNGRKMLLLGSGELGKEVIIEAQRLGVETVACDRYENAPAMQVAHKSYVFPMLEGKKIREVVEKEKPDYIVPEIEAIATDELVKLEKGGGGSFRRRAPCDLPWTVRAYASSRRKR
jgi:phosphoribosylglycinamide formyltransferase 2